MRRRRSRLAQCIRCDFAAAGTFDVDDLDDRRRARRSMLTVSAGLDQHRLARRQQPLHQRIDVLLQQRLAARDLHQRAAVASTAAITSSSDILRPSWKAYGVSHHEQRRSQAVRRTNTHGRPACVDSPWIEWKISLTVSIASSRLIRCHVRAMTLRIGTSGWNYPSGKGTWNGLFYPPREAAPPAKGFDELSFYAEHFDTVEVNSSFYGPPRAGSHAPLGRTDAAGFEFSLKLYQQFTHPEMFKRPALAQPAATPHRSALLDELARVNDADIGKFKSGIDPIASAGKLGALLAQFPAELQGHAAERDYLEWLLQTFGEYPVAVELRHKQLERCRSARRCDCSTRHKAAWVQIDEPKFQLLDPSELPAEHRRLLLHAAARTERRAVVEARQVGGSLQLPLLGRRAARVRRNRERRRRDREEGLSVSEQSLLGEVGRRTPRCSSRWSINPVPGIYSPEIVERYPELAGIVEVGSFHGFTDIFLMTSPTRILSGTSNPPINFPNTTYLPSRLGLAPSIT